MFPCKNYMNRRTIDEKCEEKLSDELEVTNLLQKVRDSYSILRNLHSTIDRELLSFNRDRVISLSDN